MIALAAVLFAGCGDDDGAPRPTPTVSPVATASATVLPSATASATSVPTPVATATAIATAEPPTTTPSVTPTMTPDESGLAKYAVRGPYAVGVTTLNIGDRDIEVWYPVDPAATAGKEKASYASFEVLPEAIKNILPPDLNIIVPMDAYRDLHASAAGPFPIFTFSHGAGGFRHAYSGLLTGIASHGFVVASLDHLEWGLLAQVNLRPPGSVDRDAGEVVLAAVDALSTASADSDSPLAGGVDATRIATAGHSAGGRAAFALPDRPEVKAMFGFATGPSSRGVGGAAHKLLLVGAEDGGAEGLEQAYEDLAPIKRFVSIDTAGHNSFTDQCAIIHGGNNFLERLVAAGFPIPEQLLALAIDGCRPENLAPAAFWQVVQHFTVAHLRAAMGLDEPPVGLGDGIATAFAPVTLRYRHEADLNAPQDGVYGFVVSGFGSVAPTHTGDVCGGAFNLSPFQHVPPLADDCAMPTAVDDPLFKTVSAPGVVDGFDLDGKASTGDEPLPGCPHEDFVGPGGEPGIDLQYWRAIGCIRGFQPGEIADVVVDQAVRDGSMTILLELRGVDDLRNDDDVRVQIYASPDAPPVGADGAVLPFGTLSASPDPRYRSAVGYGSIVDGVLTAGPMDARVRLNIQIVAGDLTFNDARVRVTLRPDGTAHGAIFGFQPVDELYDIYGRKAGAAGAAAIGYTCSGLSEALINLADGDYDFGSGRCTSLSVGYQFETVPAFVVR
ncbi:MAG: chlorophyllase/cutinase-like alpha/beta fold protein [Candidatus Binatia bacterium]